MPWREQWTTAYTKRYHNYSHRTNSPNKSQNASAKSFIQNSSITLLQLYDALAQQTVTIRSVYEAECAKESLLIREPYRNMLYSNIVEKITTRSLLIIQKQLRIAKTAILGLNEEPFRPCTELFTAQYDLRCHHMLMLYIQRKDLDGRPTVIIVGALPLLLWDNHWLLRHDLVSQNAL